MVDASFITAWVERLRSEIPQAAAVLLKGSHARGVAGPYSDVDFDVLTDGDERDDYLAFLVAADSGRLVHVSVAVQDVAAWFTAANEPEEWAFVLPAYETTHLLWARDDALRARLDRPAREHPPGKPELEDAVEGFGKVRNALLRDDDLAVRLAAQGLARLCPSLLRPINPDVRPTHRHEALLAALEFPVVPDGYRNDLLLCLGLTGCASTAQDVHDAARRLTLGILALLRAHADRVADELLPDLWGYLIDGTLERYVAQA